MLIQTLDNRTYNVEIGELYIKPFYKGDDCVSNYSICSNQRNNEVELVAYKNKLAAEHMIKLLAAYHKIEGIPLEIISEDQLLKDMFCEVQLTCRGFIK